MYPTIRVGGPPRTVAIPEDPGPIDCIIAEDLWKFIGILLLAGTAQWVVNNDGTVMGAAVIAMLLLFMANHDE